MSIFKFILRASNALLNFIVILFLCTAGAYSVYALLDNQHIYAVAKNVQEDMLQLKPDIENTEDIKASFKELLSINPDVCAWITMDGTKIDFPVVQGKTNLTYINTNVYGEFSLAGSIFLDSRSDNKFLDSYSLIYGHHMVDSNMFDDLELYKEEDFFNDNKSGNLILPDGGYDLEIYAYLNVTASEDMIFETEQIQSNIDKHLNYVEQNAIYLHKDAFEKAKKADAQILALTTCSSEFTDARTIILAVMEPHKPAE